MEVQQVLADHETEQAAQREQLRKDQEAEADLKRIADNEAADQRWLLRKQREEQEATEAERKRLRVADLVAAMSAHHETYRLSSEAMRVETERFEPLREAHEALMAELNDALSRAQSGSLLSREALAVETAPK